MFLGHFHCLSCNFSHLRIPEIANQMKPILQLALKASFFAWIAFLTTWFHYDVISHYLLSFCLLLATDHMHQFFLTSMSFFYNLFHLFGNVLFFEYTPTTSFLSILKGALSSSILSICPNHRISCSYKNSFSFSLPIISKMVS